MSGAPWQEPLRVELDAGLADVYDAADDVPVLIGTRHNHGEVFEALVHRANAYPKLVALLDRVLNTPLGTIGDCDEWDALMHEIDAALTEAKGGE